MKNNKILYISICIIIIIVICVACICIDQKNYNNYSTNDFVEQNNINNQNDNEKLIENAKIYIHVTGEIINPGVYMLNEGDRIKDAIEKAGGITKDADINNINLAYKLSDGQKIKIPNVNEKNNIIENYITENDGTNIIVQEKNDEKNKKININNASQAELETLTGIGPSTASKIIQYRKINGKFKKIEEIKNVTGIGESKYEEIKNDIVC